MEFLENFILFCCCFHFEFVKSSHSGPFINLALESKHITASSVAFGFSKSAVTDGKRVGYFERKSTVLMTKLEENPWIQVDFEAVNINREGEISAIRVYMAESECSRTLTASKSKIGKCMSSKFSDMQKAQNVRFELSFNEANYSILSHTFSAPRAIYTWIFPDSYERMESKEILSVRISTLSDKGGEKVQLAVSEIEVYTKKTVFSPQKCGRCREKHHIGESCLENVLYSTRFFPWVQESSILCGYENVRESIREIQSGCRSKSIQSVLPGPDGKGAGLGSTLFWLTGGFSDAFIQRRASVFSGTFNYAENKFCASRKLFGKLECYFEPMSSCSLKMTQNLNQMNNSSARNLLSRLYRDGPPKDKRFDIIPKVEVVPNNNLFLWRSEQIRWLTRLNSETKSLIDLENKKKSLNFTKGNMIGMHIRHGDGCKHGRRKQHGCKPLLSYIFEARALRDMYGQDVRKIFLATDSGEIIQETAHFEPEFSFVYLHDMDRDKYDSGTKIESRMQSDSIDSHALMLETLTDMFLLSECDYFVTHQASALSRVSLSLASTRLGHLPPYVSMDGPWCYHWKMCCDVKPSGDQKTC